jgi:hypothetical protein
MQYERRKKMGQIIITIEDNPVAASTPKAVTLKVSGSIQPDDPDHVVGMYVLIRTSVEALVKYTISPQISGQDNILKDLIAKSNQAHAKDS